MVENINQGDISRFVVPGLGRARCLCARVWIECCVRRVLIGCCGFIVRVRVCTKACLISVKNMKCKQTPYKNLVVMLLHRIQM